LTIFSVQPAAEADSPSMTAKPGSRLYRQRSTKAATLKTRRSGKIKLSRVGLRLAGKAGLGRPI
jgi:hypothetical protein